MTFSQMWLAGTPTRIIAETLKISADRCDVTRRELKLPRREGWHGSKKGHRKAYMPSEEEIAEKCKAFQAGWSDEERAKRLVGYSAARYAAGARVVSESALRSNYRAYLLDEVTPSGIIEDLTDRDTSGGA